MGLLTVVLIVGSVVRLGLLFLRPAAAQRFHHPRRRLLATRVEQGGDIVLLFTAACMVAFGYGRGGGGAAVPFWLVCLVGGLAMVAFAHDVARRHRPEPPSRPPVEPGATRAGAPSARPPRRTGSAAPRPARPPRPPQPPRPPGSAAPTRPGRPPGPTPRAAGPR